MLQAEPREGGTALAEPVEAVIWGAGFHAAEVDRGRSFRWMGRSATLVLPAADGVRYLRVAARSRFSDLSQDLTARSGPSVSGPLALVQGWNVLSFEVPAGATEVALETGKLLAPEEHPGDGRELGLQVSSPLLHADAERHERERRDHESRQREERRRLEVARSGGEDASAVLAYAEGFLQQEIDGGRPFRWLSRRGRVELAAADTARFLEIWVRCHFNDGSQTLTLTTATASQRFELVDGWDVVSLPLAPGTSWVQFEPSLLIDPAAHPHDAREMSLQVGAGLVHADAARHHHVDHQHQNRVLNAQEVREGRVELKSLPPKLGIDIAGSCNVKPPCVYCDWDTAKEREGENVEVPFNAFTLREYGPFFDNAAELVNCSIGEPFMVKTIDALLDVFGSRGKLVELTTNGQILTDVNIRKLLGRHAHLYISLDAATAQTYAMFRNDTLPRILDNIRRLVEAKGGPGNLPHVYLVFMPMRANVHEVDDFVRLCARLRVDRAVLRPLNPSPGTNLKWDRAGYHFDYQNELLPFDELVRVSGRVAGLCERYDVLLSDQMDFGGDLGPRFRELYEQGRREAAALPIDDVFPDDREARLSVGAPVTTAVAAAPTPVAAAPAPPVARPTTAGTNLPICTEPWTSLYVLRRGTFPCCYGGGAIAGMGEFKQAWNSPLLREIRGELREGRFHKYCFDSPDCPIVRKAHEARDMSASQTLLLQARRALDRLKRAGFGLPGRGYRLSKHYARLALGRLRGTPGAAPRS